VVITHKPAMHALAVEERDINLFRAAGHVEVGEDVTHVIEDYS